MKFNWGTKIGLFYGGFVVFILGMVYLSFGQQYDLVTEDYYAQEIAYQAKIESKERAAERPLKISIQGQHLQVDFGTSDKHDLSGNMHCFRPSNEQFDYQQAIQVGQSVQKIPLEKLHRGKYLLKVDWEQDGLSYYEEQTIIIP